MKTALLILLLSSGASLAATSECPQLFVGGVSPAALKEALKSRATEVCYSDFAVMHSGLTAGPLWSAENISSDDVRDAKAVARVDSFFAEPSVAPEDRAELEHYRGSGYDRGHMAPSADMTTEKSQAESFSLANMVPQTPNLNRKLWANIESTTRGLALSYGQVFVVTGPAFSGANLKRIGGRVLVPTATYKAVYVPSQNAAGAWWADNTQAGDSYEVISIKELERRIAVDVFPALPEDVKATQARLPAPKAGADRAAGTRPTAAREPSARTADGTDGWLDVVWAVGEEMIRRWLR